MLYFMFSVKIVSVGGSRIVVVCRSLETKRPMCVYMCLAHQRLKSMD